MHQSRLNAFNRVLRIGADPESRHLLCGENAKKGKAQKREGEKKREGGKNYIYFILKIIVLIF